jgi:ADP-heptose:LPS heptosyltransferase
MRNSSAKLPGRGNRLFRSADKYAGVPLLALIGALRRKRPKPHCLGRIGILTTAAIGDTILIGAILGDLRAALPDSRIIFLAGDSNHAAAALLSPAPDSLLRIPVYKPLEASRIVRECDLDVLLDFGPWPRLNALIAWLSGAKFTLGFRTAGQFRHYAFDKAVEHSPLSHELENHRRMIAQLGIEATHVPAIDLSKLLTRSDFSPPDPYLVFHLWPGGTASREKEWPTERWTRLARHFAAQGYAIAFTGAPSQRQINQDVIDSIDSQHQPLLWNAAGLSLAETAGLTAASRMVVSVDTGIMHLAAALGVPLIALHGPSSSKRWGPVGRNAVALDSPDPRGGYLYLGFESPSHPPRCMEALTYDRVLEECLKKLNIAGAAAIRRSHSIRAASNRPQSVSETG